MTKTAMMRVVQSKINCARLEKGNMAMKVKEEKDKEKVRAMFLYVETLDEYVKSLMKLKKFLQTEADLELSRTFILVETQEEMEELEAQYDGFYVTFSEEHITPYTTVDLFDKLDEDTGKAVYEYYVQIENVPYENY